MAFPIFGISGDQGIQSCLIFPFFSFHQVLPFPVASVQKCRQQNPFSPPPLQRLPHYYEFFRTSHPHRCFHPYVSALGIFAFHEMRGFSCSLNAPASRSCSLYADSPLPSIQVIRQNESQWRQASRRSGRTDCLYDEQRRAEQNRTGTFIRWCTRGLNP